MDLLEWLFLMIGIIMAMVYVLRSRDKKVAMLILFTLLLVYGFYAFIGHLLQTDILNAVTLHKNGFCASFIGILLLSITTAILLCGIFIRQGKK